MYKQYDKYKICDVEMTEKIPSNWDVIKMRYLGNLNSSGVDKKIRDNELLFKSIHYTDVYKNRLKEIGYNPEYLEISATPEKKRACSVMKGDVLFTNSSETPDDIGNAVVIKENLPDVLFGYHLTRFRPTSNIHFEYLKYLFTNKYIKNWFSSRACGITRYGITYYSFADAKLILPPIEEQKLIAQYLDEKLTTIQAKITSANNMIAIMTEKKEVLIHNAVTKGIRRDVPMKDSCIEWIGSIPESWEVTRIKYICGINQDVLSSNTNPSFSFDYVDIGSVQFGKGIVKKSPMIFEDAPSRARRRVKSGDVIISTVRTYLKAIAVITDEDVSNIFSTGFAVIRPRSLFKEYIPYLLMSKYVIDTIVSESYGVSYPAISQTKISNIVVPFPKSNKEQVEIINYLKEELTTINNTIEKSQQLINKLIEYQEALITAAVTGQINVGGEE